MAIRKSALTERFDITPAEEEEADNDADFHGKERPYVHSHRRQATHRHSMGLVGPGGQGIHPSSTQNPRQEEHPRPHRGPLG